MNAHRLLVLLLIAAGIVLSGRWPQPGVENTGSAYFWTEDGIIRRNQADAGEGGLPLNQQLSCAATPAAVARFFGLALPINQADLYTLTTLPGIGPKLAENIIQYRQEQGFFTGPQDLVKVRGIGPKRSQQIIPLLCFSEPQ
jgi:competence protein ComEA